MNYHHLVCLCLFMTISWRCFLISSLVVIQNGTKLNVNSIITLGKSNPDTTIFIKKESEFSFFRRIDHVMDNCTQRLQNGKIVRTCRTNVGNRNKFSIIPADNLNDLYSNESYLYHNTYKKVRPYAAHLILLHDVAIHKYGDIIGLDGTAYYSGVCRHYGGEGYEDLNITRGNVEHIFYHPVANLITLWQENYFHSLNEYLPRFLSLLPLIRKRPNIQIFNNLHHSPMHSFIKPILNYYGLHPERLNFVNMEYGKVFFANHLITPISSCKFIPKQFVRMIRRAVANLYNIDRSNSTMDTIVVHDRRSEEERYIPQGDELHEYLLSNYKNKYIIKQYRGYLTLEETAKLFNSCKLFIAPHGAGHSNIMFMNSNSAVIEIRPQTLLNSWYFSYLASINGVRYQYFFSTTNNSNLYSKAMYFDMDKVIEVVKNLL